MTDMVSTGAVTTLIQVVIIDLVLAGDNAVVIGLAAGSLGLSAGRFFWRVDHGGHPCRGASLRPHS